MAQKSLPRINRINVSMFWENYNPYNNRGGFSLKILIFLKQFSRFFLKYDIFYFKRFWKKNKNWTILLKKHVEKRQFNFDYKTEYTMIPFNVYIYSIFDKNYILFIQSSIESIEKNHNNDDLNALMPQTFLFL